jgi:prepilin-type N-terminal cleavage/methylation domain-containing protein
MRSSRGFSLVELLVVVAVIALLASMLLPGLSRAREYAYFSSCKNSQRQIGIGFLIFAADNRGRLLLGDIDEYVHGESKRKIGFFTGYSWLRPWARNPHIDLVEKIYDNEPGEDWNNDSHASYWIGRPRMKGKYLPVEGLWDPIVKVRAWTYQRYSDDLLQADTEKNRDRLTRYRGLGNWRGRCPGYAFFTGKIGCDPFKAGDLSESWHVLANGYDPAPAQSSGSSKAEEPLRPNTNSCNVSTSHKASVWLGACLPPIEGEPASNWAHRVNRGHFGVVNPGPGQFKYNVVHLDGHVHDTLWTEPEPSPGGWILDKVPYGWKWKDAGESYGIELRAGFSGAFDENK